MNQSYLCKAFLKLWVGSISEIVGCDLQLGNNPISYSLQISYSLHNIAGNQYFYVVEVLLGSFWPMPLHHHQHFWVAKFGAEGELCDGKV